MAMLSQFLTCVFKLHNPSRWRRQALDHTFERYTLAMTDLLAWCEHNLDTIRENGKYESWDKYTANSVAGCLPKCGELDIEIASCLKESLIDSVASGLASYLELEDMEGETGFPTSRDPSPQAWPNALLDLAVVGNDKDAEDRAAWKVKRQVKSGVMPLPFIRARDFAIQYDVANDRWFVALKLLPARHELGRRSEVRNNKWMNLSAQTFPRRSDVAILFPLQVGRRNGGWHWQYDKFLLPTIGGQTDIKSAKLLRKGGEYFLHVSFEFECPEPYEPEAYLGVDKGVLYTVAYGVVDLDGCIIDMGHEDDGLRSLQIEARRTLAEKQRQGRKVTIHDHRGRQGDSILHKLANRIIEIAKAHKAQIVVEDLNINVRGSFVTSSWNKLDDIIDYKAVLGGVPARRGVFAAKSSMICVWCGELVGYEGPHDRLAVCGNCGKREHRDEMAGVNIARRALYRKDEWEGGYREFHRSFSNVSGFSTNGRVAKRGSAKAQQLVLSV